MVEREVRGMYLKGGAVGQHALQFIQTAFAMLHRLQCPMRSVTSAVVIAMA